MDVTMILNEKGEVVGLRFELLSPMRLHDFCLEKILFPHMGPMFPGSPQRILLRRPNPLVGKG
jgi:hypothetical protein